MKLNLNLNLKNIKIDKNFYKNPKFLIIVGTILVIFGGISYVTKPQKTYVETGKVDTEKLSEEQAKNVIESLMANAISVYENPSLLFKVSDANIDIGEEKSEDDKKEENANNAKLISNYSDVIKTIFSDNGIKQLEKMTFESKKYVYKKSDVVYFINDVIDKEYSLTDIAFTYSMFTIKKDSITCNINFNKVTVDEDNAVNYYIITKPIKLVKNGDTWLIDSFNYTNG